MVGFDDRSVDSIEVSFNVDYPSDVEEEDDHRHHDDVEDDVEEDDDDDQQVK